MRTCYLCGKTGNDLELHHIFGASNRNFSERYGLTVYLCGDECHRNGKRAVHRCRETMDELHKYGQRIAMRENGWTIDEFRARVGRNYLDPEDLIERKVVNDFRILEDDE